MRDLGLPDDRDMAWGTITAGNSTLKLVDSERLLERFLVKAAALKSSF